MESSKMANKSKLLSLLSMIALTQTGFAGMDFTVGKAKFDKHCTVCHSKAMAKVMKSPEAHVPEKWHPFIKDAVLDSAKLKTTNCSKLTSGKKDTSKLSLSDKDLSGLTLQEKACYLLPNAKAGHTRGAAVMPPKGTCMDCSDDELLSAIGFMNKKEK